MWSSGMDGVLLDLRQKRSAQDVRSESPDCDDPETSAYSRWHPTSPHPHVFDIQFSLLQGFENGSNQRLPLNCPDCGKSFSHSSSLKRHSRTHTGVRPFICSICNKGFHYKNNLQDHARTHTGEKPFKCPDCGQSFAQSSTLNRHIGTHGKDKTCQICGKSFIKLSLLQKHIACHVAKGEIELPVMGGNSDQNLNLMELRCKANSLKSLQSLVCVKCGMKFGRAVDLQQHFWTHIGEGQVLFHGLLNMLELMKQEKTQPVKNCKPEK